MTDKERGLGRVVYSVNEGDQAVEEELPSGEPLVEEASEESFPASDPPSYARGTSEHTSGGAAETTTGADPGS
jgi:hypothetical protein